MSQASTAARLAAEAAARESYGRLLAWLAAQWRDLQAAEDALSEAFVSALQTWPENGVPDSPEAWLLAAARRNLLQMHRHRKVVSEHALSQWLDDDEGLSDGPPPVIADQRLRLMYVCAHPANDPSLHSALMLQTVLGLDARAIAPAFLVSPAAMAQRLVRAKAKIRDAGVGFEEPESHQVPARTQAVLEAIYAAYGLAWDAALTGAGETRELSGEAIFLARLVVSMRPDDAEAAGLLALLLFCESRDGARSDEDGAFVPLHRQDCARWNRAMMDEADQVLWRASALRRPGPFQLEAAIQSAHAQRARTGRVPWPAIALLYRALLACAPTTGARVGFAVALGESGDAASGLAELDALQAATVAGYAPYWVARAHLLAALDRRAQARHHYERAIGLSESAAIRAHLGKCLAALGPASAQDGSASN